MQKLNVSSNFPPPATPVPRRLANVPGTSHFATTIRSYIARLVISGFVGLSAARSYGERDSVDAENLPGSWITRNYLDWSYLADYRLDFKTIAA